MAAPKSFRSQGIVLESKPLGEADLMVTLLTSDEGKLRAVARGARKTTSKLVGHLEPLNRVDMSVARGKEFQYVSQAQVLENFLPLKTGLGGVTRGLYMAELASWYAVEEAPGSRIHDLLLDGLRFLPECKSPDIVLRCFEMQLLKVSGFMPELYCCVDCGEELSPKGHQFSPALGGTLCDRCRPSGVAVRPMSLDALKVLRFLANTTMPEADRLRLESELAEEVSRLLSLLLSYWPDHEIRSRRFMDHVRTDAPFPSFPPPLPSFPRRREPTSQTPPQQGTPCAIRHFTRPEPRIKPRCIKYRGVRQERPMTPRTLRVRVGDRWLTVEIEDASHSPVRVRVEGQTFLVEVEGFPEAPHEVRPPPVLLPRPARQEPQALDKVLRSPMPARVVAVRVRPGDRVSRGQEVCVVEAMKMEQSIRAPQDGTVKTVHVTPLQQVTSGEPLLELE